MRRRRFTLYPLPFTNAPSVTNFDGLWQQITNNNFPAVYVASSNDFRFFRGIFTPNSSSSKLAVHSDDGSTMSIDGSSPNPDLLGTDTHFLQSSSLVLLTNSFVAGQDYCVEISYSNHLHTAGDKDGVTLYAYDGGGTVRTGLLLRATNDAVCVGGTMTLTVSCGTTGYGWSSWCPPPLL